MTEERLLFLAVRDEVEKMPEADQKIINDVASNLRHMIIQAGPHGHMALALVGAQLSAENAG